jgi:hypothetical protein
MVNLISHATITDYRGNLSALRAKSIQSPVINACQDDFSRHISLMTLQPQSLVSLSPAEAAIACLSLSAHVYGPASEADHVCISAVIAATPHLRALPDSDVAAVMHLAQDIISAPEGLETMIDMLAGACTSAQQQTLYALSVEFIVRRAGVSPEEMRLLDLLAEAFALAPLTRAAIDQASRIRLAPLAGD